MDPVEIVLGKDVALLIHKFVHKSLVALLNDEYRRWFKTTTKYGAIVFFLFNCCGRSGKLFNYRRYNDWTEITTWHPQDPPNPQKRPLKRWRIFSCAALPSRYW